jgi:NADH:ubiquinone oxidoreductase subunit F (NADH-binding)
VRSHSPFFALQSSLVLENSGRVEPERIESYIAAGGYRALHDAIYEMRPDEVIDAITRSGLRGRGGAGYPTGVKWATVAKNPGQRKYVVCNADEGDPGAFMNRSVLESDPHRVLEGMAIAGYAVARIRATSTFAANIRWPSSGCKRRSRQAGTLRAAWARVSSPRRSTFASTSASAPGRLCAAKRRR